MKYHTQSRTKYESDQSINPSQAEFDRLIIRNTVSSASQKDTDIRSDRNIIKLRGHASLTVLEL